MALKCQTACIKTRQVVSSLDRMLQDHKILSSLSKLNLVLESVQRLLVWDHTSPAVVCHIYALLHKDLTFFVINCEVTCIVEVIHCRY